MTTQQVSGWSGFRQSNGDARADLVTTDIIDILDTIDVPIVVIGRSFMVASFNRAAAEVLRLEPSDIGLSPRDTLVLVGLVQLEEWCAEVMATGAARRHDFRHGDKSFVVHITLHKKQMRDRHGAHVHQRDRFPRKRRSGHL
jgi:PAS domain-containing protein